MSGNAIAQPDLQAIREPAWLGFVENIDTIKAVTGVNAAGYMVLLPSDAVHHVSKSHGHGRDGKEQRPVATEDYDQVWRVLPRAM